MFLNKIGLAFGENDQRNIDVVRNQNITLDRQPVVSDLDADSATKTGFLRGYKDLTGGSVLYHNTNHIPVYNPTFPAQFTKTSVENPVGLDFKSMYTVPIIERDVKVPEYIGTVNMHRVELMKSIFSRLNQSNY
jgi:hypothetical protein